MILDGRAVAEDIYTELTNRRAAYDKPLTLGIVVGGANPVIEQFVKIKERAAARLGIEMIRVDLPQYSNTEAAIEVVRTLAEKTNALIVQLPLPSEIDTTAVLSEIPSGKDVDAINPLQSMAHLVEAPVALAVVALLKRGDVQIEGKKAVVIGAGRLVGAPSAALLRKLGAEVSIFTLDEGSTLDLKDADIIVCGAGNPGFVNPEHIKDGVAIIDAGASEESGIIRGDADPACADKASVFTPVPGGVGPVAVAMIFKNLLDLVEIRV